MKIIVGILALNEIDYISCTLNSIRPFCDKIIVVEGCAKKTFDYLYEEGFVTKAGMSTDGTTEFLQQQNDIEYHPLGIFPGGVEEAAYPLFLDASEVGDWIWCVCGNEVFSDDAAKQIVETMKSNDYDAICCRPIVLWKDFQHRIVGGGWTNYRIYCYKNQRYNNIPLYYKGLQHILLPSNFATLTKRIANITDALLKLPFVRDFDRVYYKIAWQEIEFNNRLDNLGKYRNLREYITSTNHFYTEMHDKIISVVEYTGLLPETIPVEIISKYSNIYQGDIWQDV